MVSWESVITPYSFPSRGWCEHGKTFQRALPCFFLLNSGSKGKLGPDSCPASHISLQMAQGGYGV